jgi:hypothetical protein
MGPIEHSILGRAVETLDDILGGPGKVERLQAEVLPARRELGNEVIATRDMIRVPEHLDVGVEGFQGVLGVLGLGLS